MEMKTRAVTVWSRVMVVVMVMTGVGRTQDWRYDDWLYDNRMMMNAGGGR